MSQRNEPDAPRPLIGEKKKIMKKNLLKLPWICALVAGAALIGFPASVRAALAPNPTENYTNTFDTVTDAASWIYWYGVTGGNSQILWDATKDAATNSASGSLAINIPFGTSGNQQVFFGTFGNGGGFDGSILYNGNQFTNIVVDVLVDPSAPVSSVGDFGVLEYSLVRSGTPAGGGPFTATVRIPGAASNGWVRLNMPVPVGIDGYDDPGVMGVGFKYTSYSGYPKSTISFWLDNLQVQASVIQAPPPSLSTQITSANPGLNLLSTSAASEFQRTSVKLINQTGIGFVGQSDVTYSMTIKEFPDPDVYPNYQAHIFFSTGPGNSPSLDYNETNLIWLNVQGNAGGGATAYFRYKINEPNSNSNLFGAEYTVGPVGTPWAGQLTNLTAATPIGTWSMTFNQDTNVTLNGPGGVSTSFTIRPEVAAAFVDPLNLAIGAQPNRPSESNPLGNVGQKVVLADIGATNGGTSTSLLFDNFLADSTLNTTNLSILANAANTVFVYPNDPGQKLVKWSLPDTGFYLEAATNLATNAWLPVSSAATFSAGGFRTALVPSSVLSPEKAFFRLVKREFTKLQILLPGETAAPGTPSGKTGTPTPQPANATFPVVVNAVDSNWVRITSVTDQISLSSSDPGFTWPGFPGTMAGGTITFDAETWQLAFVNAGSQTITATDVTDGSKTADTSSSVTVTP